MLDHIASNLGLSKEKISEKILNHALEIIYLLTGEKYVLVMKKSPHCCIHPKAETVPVKCDDIAVYFSMEEWDYVKGHKQQYQNIITETGPVSDTMDIADPETAEDDLDRSSPELSDLHVEEIDYDSISAKNVVECDEEEEDDYKEKHRYARSSAHPGTSAATSFPSIIDDSIPVTSLLDESEIKVEMTEEIKEDGTYESLVNKTYTPAAAPAPHYRWHPNIWSVSERFICGGNSRSFYPFTNIKPSNQDKPPEPSRLQFIDRVLLEEKPFRCIACGQMFKHKSSAMRHYSVVHGVKPHQCDECGKRFSTKFKSVIHKCNPRKNRDVWDDQAGFNT
ncbi:hypothetical protein GDO81_003226 [Engystomops pustulosus]|nr:hypothetical protein GDO81_003226 [Engystomops pustulosus]KAG8553024.1 hypothetical protein GDO81_003226 [Engystomops pustulosus]